MTAFIKENDLKQTALWNYRAVCGFQLLGGIQAKGYVKDFAVCADAVSLIFCKALYKVDFHTLTLIDKSRCCFGHCDFLSCVHKLYGVDFLIQHHAIRGCGFLDLVFAKVQLFRFCRAVRTCGNGVNDLALGSPERTVQSINILGSTNLIDSPLQTAEVENRLIQALVACHGGEHLARLLHGNCAFLCHVGAYHFNERNAAFLLGVLLHHIKINRLGV